MAEKSKAESSGFVVISTVYSQQSVAFTATILVISFDMSAHHSDSNPLKEALMKKFMKLYIFGVICLDLVLLLGLYLVTLAFVETFGASFPQVLGFLFITSTLGACKYWLLYLVFMILNVAALFAQIQRLRSRDNRVLVGTPIVFTFTRQEHLGEYFTEVRTVRDQRGITIAYVDIATASRAELDEPLGFTVRVMDHLDRAVRASILGVRSEEQISPSWREYQVPGVVELLPAADGAECHLTINLYDDTKSQEVSILEALVRIVGQPVIWADGIFEELTVKVTVNIPE